MLSKLAIAPIVAAFVALVAPGIAAAAPEAGQVLALNGSCIDEAGGQRVALKAGDAVHVGDTVEVPGGGKLKLRMQDGSVLSVAANSRLTIQNYQVDGSGQQRDAKLSLAEGLVRAVVAKMNQPSSFEIVTATSVAAARSTDWFVEARPGSTRIAVLEGSVGVTRPAGGNGVLVPPREGTSVDAGRSPLAPRIWTQAVFDQLVERTNLSLGWCQCIDERTAIQGACRPSVEACQAYCAGRHYSYLVNAPQTCGGGS